MQQLRGSGMEQFDLFSRVILWVGVSAWGHTPWGSLPQQMLRLPPAASHNSKELAAPLRRGEQCFRAMPGYSRKWPPLWKLLPRAMPKTRHSSFGGAALLPPTNPAPDAFAPFAPLRSVKFFSIAPERVIEETRMLCSPLCTYSCNDSFMAWWQQPSQMCYKAYHSSCYQLFCESKNGNFYSAEANFYYIIRIITITMYNKYTKKAV